MAPGEAIREASRHLTSFSPRLDRDLAHLDVVDLGAPDGDRAWFSETRRGLVASGTQPGLPGRLHSAHPDLTVLVFSAAVAQVLRWGASLGRGRAYALGSRVYDRPTRDEVRNTQRLLPLDELCLETAARTAVEESGNAPLWISLDLDVLEPHLVPGVPIPAPGGCSLPTLRSALRAIPGERVIGFEIGGYPPVEERANFLTALTAAELLRDNILVWWGT